MVNDIFGDQIGRKMEVYVDDIILKFKKVNMSPQDTSETLSKFRKVGMKLNPKKCVFGLPVGKCLEFMVSEPGVD